MKKIHKRRGKVHPSPAPPQSQPPINHLISLLPATILTLTAALSPEDMLVLAYLISFSANTTNTAAAAKTSADCPKKHNSSTGVDHQKKNNIKSTGADYHKKNNSGTIAGGGEHGPMFQCNCFRCYISYWVRWDTSPNRELIHEIIEEYEENLFREKKIKMNNRASNKKHRERRTRMTSSSPSSVVVSDQNQRGKMDGGGGGGQLDLVAVNRVGGEADDVGGDDVENGNLRRFVSFLGDKIWSVWN